MFARSPRFSANRHRKRESEKPSTFDAIYATQLGAMSTDTSSVITVFPTHEKLWNCEMRVLRQLYQGPDTITQLLDKEQSANALLEDRSDLQEFEGNL